MSSSLSPENEQFIRRAIDCGVFADRGQALDQAVELLRKRQELLWHIDEGTRQLRAGEGIELEGDDALWSFFNEIRTEGMRRREADSSAP